MRPYLQFQQGSHIIAQFELSMRKGAPGFPQSYKDFKGRKGRNGDYRPIGWDHYEALPYFPRGYWMSLVRLRVSHQSSEGPVLCSP
ncbi:MAG: hypothetical protein Q8R28_03020, partial [Dehalococcoidia bacterium]|nr:hypothetical protein [Dehalococcoidia bacterium]